MKLEKALNAIVGLIVCGCDPDEIILFGSYAKGNDRPDSDLDILVIGKFPESRYLRDRELKGLLSPYPIGIDLVLMTPEEIALGSQKPASFLNSIRMHGIQLYKKP